jgi:hypothetical protein
MNFLEKKHLELALKDESEVKKLVDYCHMSGRLAANLAEDMRRVINTPSFNDQSRDIAKHVLMIVNEIRMG